MSKSNIHNCYRCGNIVKRNKSKRRNGQVSDRVFCCRECYDQQRIDDRTSAANNCQNCGKIMAEPRAVKGRKFCNKNCKDELYSRLCVTECKVCKTVFSAIKWRYENGITTGYVKDKTRAVCSPECVAENYRTDEERKRKISESERGEKHHNWQGGGKRRGFRGQEWPKLSEEIRKRANYKCEHCGKTQEENGRKLDVNHIEPFHQHRNKTQANRPSNLEALCKSCHMKADWKWRKSNSIQYAIKF